MTISVVGKNEAVGTGPSVAVTEPVATGNNDMLFCFAVSAKGSALTFPPGWTTIAAFTSSSATQAMWSVGYIRRGPAAYSTAQMTWTLTGSVYREIYLVALHSNTTWPVLDAQSAAGGTGTTAVAAHNIDPPVVTAGTAPTVALAGGLFWGGASGVWTFSAGYTAQTTNSATADVILESKALAVTGSEDPGTATGGAATSSDWWDGFTVTWADAQPIWYPSGPKGSEQMRPA